MVKDKGNGKDEVKDKGKIKDKVKVKDKKKARKGDDLPPKLSDLPPMTMCITTYLEGLRRGWFRNADSGDLEAGATRHEASGSGGPAGVKSHGAGRVADSDSD